jgi:hypothetical protein
VFRNILIIAALITSAGASPLAAADSHSLIAQLQITDGEPGTYGNQASPKAFGWARERTGPEGKKAFQLDRDARLLEQLQLTDGNPFGRAFN